jgi:hypothetical protein
MLDALPTLPNLGLFTAGASATVAIIAWTVKTFKNGKAGPATVKLDSEAMSALQRIEDQNRRSSEKLGELTLVLVRLSEVAENQEKLLTLHAIDAKELAAGIRDLIKTRG